MHCLPLFPFSFATLVAILPFSFLCTRCSLSPPLFCTRCLPPSLLLLHWLPPFSSLLYARAAPLHSIFVYLQSMPTSPHLFCTRCLTPSHLLSTRCTPCFLCERLAKADSSNTPYDVATAHLPLQALVVLRPGTASSLNTAAGCHVRRAPVCHLQPRRARLLGGTPTMWPRRLHAGALL